MQTLLIILITILAVDLVVAILVMIAIKKTARRLDRMSINYSRDHLELFSLLVDIRDDLSVSTDEEFYKENSDN